MAVDIAVDTVQGTIAEEIHFHLDTGSDVLYVRSLASRGERVFGEETPAGYTAFRTDDGHYTGATIVNFWRDHGRGPISEASLETIRTQIARWVREHPG